MSAEEGATQNGALPTATEVPELDVSKLHALPSEQQDLFPADICLRFSTCH